MIHPHRSGTRLIACAVFLATLPAVAADDKGRLIMYDSMTEIGVVAKREFHDGQGRLIREICYTVDWGKRLPSSAPATAATTRPFSANGPFDPEKLRVYDVSTYDYDSQGRRVRSSSFSPD